jgi:phosphomannomutase
VAALYQQFPKAGLKFAIGGQISIDVFPVGWDKTFCLQFLEKAGFKTIHYSPGNPACSNQNLDQL